MAKPQPGDMSVVDAVSSLPKAPAGRHSLQRMPPRWGVGFLVMLVHYRHAAPLGIDLLLWIRMRSFFKLLIISLLGTAALTSCGDACNGNIETLVLYAKPGPKGVGRATYVDVLNKPGLGIKKTLLYEGKEFGTFEHVIIINDPESRFAKNSKICFTTYQALKAETGGDLNEEGIPEIRVEK